MRLLPGIELQIKKAAEAGKSYVALYGDVPWGAKTTWEAVAATPMQERIINKLKEYGFTAYVSRDGEAYVPKSMEDDFNSPYYVNYVIRVEW